MCIYIEREDGRSWWPWLELVVMAIAGVSGGEGEAMVGAGGGEGETMGRVGGGEGEAMAGVGSEVEVAMVRVGGGGHRRIGGGGWQRWLCEERERKDQRNEYFRHFTPKLMYI